MKFVLATANPDKAAEIVAILDAACPGIQLLPRPADHPEVDETDTTLEGNARLKAMALVEATGFPAIADDTGLEVDALDGAPGVYSSRFAGEHATYADNVAELLERLEGVAHAARRARFATIAIARWPDGREVIARGAVEGAIAVAPRGVGGFGYDPIFVPIEGDGRTFAEMTPNEKHELSHRGRAFRALGDRLGERLGGGR